MAVWNGQIYVPASIANAEIIKEESVNIVSEQPYALLSRKQQEIFALLRGGLSNKEIAQRINVSETAIKSQNRVIYRKLGALKRIDFVHC
ncbi:LuxR C-terminal-related transcriptional regulator [Methylobacterium durans]|uniref:response regulator transcription factor n=1 Tax=Methylobacterium durans TaxID=2202825 RepID=UPI0013A59A07